MPLYIDIHELPPGITSEMAAREHVKDLEIQGTYGVDYSKYWYNEETGKLFCLCTAPSAEVANAVHAAAHDGMTAHKIIEVTPELAEIFMGAAEADPCGAVLLPSAAHGSTAWDPATRSVFFTDIVSSTDLTQRVGDDTMVEMLAVHDRIVRAAIADFGGREAKHTGDGIMAVFLSAAGAIRCAVQSQKELMEHSAANPSAAMQMRIGIAAGEPVERSNDFFGTTVQLAARLCAHALPDQILVADVVAELCAGKGIAFADAGELSLKGFDHAISARTVSWG